jgi:8-oxo-dGTP diphosphatase
VSPAAPPPFAVISGSQVQQALQGSEKQIVVRRLDGGNWDLPGGRIEVGETAGQAVIREVAKESGVRIALAGLSGDRYLSARSRASGRSE